MWKWLTLGFLLLPPSHAAPRKTPPVPELILQVEKKYADAGTLVANFSQVNTSGALGTKKTSTGRLFVKRPDKVRWETLSPDPNILVSNGKKFWFYTPPFDASEHGQLIERRSSEVQSLLATALLSGNFSSQKNLTVKKLSLSKFAVTPRAGAGGGLNKALVQLDPDKKVILRVILDQAGGNKSEVELFDVKLGDPLADAVFEFKAPPNTDRVAE